MVILFFVMLILQPQNAKGADVLTAGNLGAIIQYADGASTANSTLLLTNATDPATVIVLSSFTAVPSETEINTIDINWVTSSEIDTAGFNIYRDEAENGQYTTQLNPELIPSTGSSTNGVSYNFEDAPVATGKIYYYMLEAIDLNGYKKMYGPASANWPCQTDADCGNGLFCDGEEKCQNDGSCFTGQSPCAQGQTCDEDNNQCISSSSSTSTTISATTSIITTSTISPVTTSTTTISSTSTTISATTSIITTSTISPVTTPTTTISPASTTISATTSIITTSTTSPVTTPTTTISPTSTTTTTQLSTTTAEPTTTSTIQSGPCAAEAIYGENSEETELLRKYRDKVLSKTPEGPKIITTYYKFSPTVTMLLEQRPLLKNRAKTLIDGMLPGIRKKVEESNKEP
jgi:hypothetical protein